MILILSYYFPVQAAVAVPAAQRLELGTDRTGNGDPNSQMFFW